MNKRRKKNRSKKKNYWINWVIFHDLLIYYNLTVASYADGLSTAGCKPSGSSRFLVCFLLPQCKNFLHAGLFGTLPERKGVRARTSCAPFLTSPSVVSVWTPGCCSCLTYLFFIFLSRQNLFSIHFMRVKCLGCSFERKQRGKNCPFFL